MKCVTSLDEVNEPLRYVCLQWAKSSSAEKGDSVGKGGRDRELVAAVEGTGQIPF